MVLGERSRGLCAFDLDDMDGYRRWCDDHSELASWLPTAKTPRYGGGRHVFAYSEEPTRFQTQIDGGQFLGERHICVLPPSLHKSGGRYQWLNSPFDREIPTLNANELASLVHSVNPFKAKDIGGFSPAPSQSPKYHTSHVMNGSFIDYAISQTIPTAFGQRHERLFQFARYLRLTFDESEPESLRPHVEAWYLAALPRIRTKRFDVTWKRFCNAWEDVRLPFGAALGAITALAVQEPVVLGRNTNLERVASVLRAAFKIHGGNEFVMDFRTLGDCVGMRWNVVNRLARQLVELRLLEIPKPGKSGNGKPTGTATTWRWLGE